MFRAVLIAAALALALVAAPADAERSLRKSEYTRHAQRQAAILQIVHRGFRKGADCVQMSRTTARCTAWTEVYLPGQHDPCGVCHPGVDRKDHVDRISRRFLYRVVHGRLVVIPLGGDQTKRII